jgi:hypothetical protein
MNYSLAENRGCVTGSAPADRVLNDVFANFCAVLARAKSSQTEFFSTALAKVFCPRCNWPFHWQVDRHP